MTQPGRRKPGRNPRTGDFVVGARATPEIGRMLTRSRIMRVKYRFSVSDEEQKRRFQARLNIPGKRWKLSLMDIESHNRSVAYPTAKDAMFSRADTDRAPWYVVNSGVNKPARLNCTEHLLSMIPYEETASEPVAPGPPECGTG